MKNLLIVTGITTVLMIGAQTASAAPNHKHYKQGKQHQGLSINARQQKQAHRIRQGKHDGSLTRTEVRSLRQQQKRIKRLERHFRADGKLTRVERRQLQKRLDRASRNIAAERRDNEYRRVRHARNQWKRW